MIFDALMAGTFSVEHSSEQVWHCSSSSVYYFKHKLIQYSCQALKPKTREIDSPNSWRPIDCLSEIGFPFQVKRNQPQRGQLKLQRLPRRLPRVQRKLPALLIHASDQMLQPCLHYTLPLQRLKLHKIQCRYQVRFKEVGLLRQIHSLGWDQWEVGGIAVGIGTFVEEVHRLLG